MTTFRKIRSIRYSNIHKIYIRQKKIKKLYHYDKYLELIISKSSYQKQNVWDKLLFGSGGIILDKITSCYTTILLFTFFVFLLSSIFAPLYSQHHIVKTSIMFQYPESPNSQINVNVFVKDNYTQAPLDSALAKLVRSGLLLDSGYTNSQGNVLLRFIPLSNSEGQNPVPREFSLSYSYPNPADNQVKTNITIPAPGTLEYAVYDALGKKVFGAKEAVESGNYQLWLDELDQLSQGIYFLQVLYNHQQAVAKIAKVGNSVALASGNIQARISQANPFEPNYQEPSNHTEVSRQQVLDNVTLNISKQGYLPIAQNHTITKDTSFTIGLTKQNNITIANVYPNGQPVINAQVRINNQNYLANNQGIINLPAANSGQYRIVSIDPRTTLDTLLTIISDTLASAKHNEKISFPYFPAAINEDDSTMVPANAVTFGTSGSFSVESLNPNLLVKLHNGNYWLVPKKDQNGFMEFKLIGTGINSTTAQATRTLEVKPASDLVLQIVDSDINQATLPAYLKIGTDSIFSPTATFMTQILAGQSKTFVAGLTRKDNYQMPWSFQRTFSVTAPANGQDLDTVVQAAISYYLRDSLNLIRDSFYIPGFSPITDSSKMTPQRFKGFLNFVHFSTFYNGIPGPGGHYNNLHRWTLCNDEMLPDSIVIAMTCIHQTHTATMQEVTKNRVINIYNNWVKPLIGNKNIPIKIRTTPVVYPPPIDGNYVLVVPNGTMTTDGTAALIGLPPATIRFCDMELRSGPPGGDVGEPWGTRAALQEIFTVLVGGNPGVYNNPWVRQDESILHDQTLLYTKISLYDYKYLRMFYNNKFITGEHIDTIMK